MFFNRNFLQNRENTTLINFRAILYNDSSMELKFAKKGVKEEVLDLQEIQLVAQLVENMVIISEKLENAYNKREGEEFIKARGGIIESHRKITDILGN